VIARNVPGDTVTVRLSGTGRRCVCSRASVCGSRQEYEAAHPDAGGRIPPGEAPPRGAKPARS
jgi:hypothetical protein